MSRVALAERGSKTKARFGSAVRVAPVRHEPVVALQPTQQPKDYFVHRDGLVYAGTHLILDLWGATRLNELDTVERALREAIEAAGATLLHIHLHHFTPNGGISGVAVLAESHISVHTWPERGFAAFDIFMCGAAEPMKAVPVLERHFGPDRVVIEDLKRGLVK